MGRYTTMINDMWTDPAFTALGPTERLLYNYLLNSPVNNAAGYYRLTKAQLRVDMCREDDSTDTGFMAEDEKLFTEKILPALTSQCKLWKYDEKTKQVLVPNYLKYNKIVGPKQMGPLINALLPLQKSPLHILFFKECLVYMRQEDLNLLWSRLDEKTRAYVRTECKVQDDNVALNVARTLVLEGLINNNTTLS